MKMKQIQFSVLTLMSAVGFAAVLYGAASMLPTAVLNVAIAGIVFLAGSAAVFVALLMLEKYRTRKDGVKSLAIGSIVLTSFSLCIIGLTLIPLPGGRGPVQYWQGDVLAMFVFRVRFVAMLAMMLCPIICGLIGKIRLDLGMPFQLPWLINAISSYVIACTFIVTNGFFPTV